MKNDKIVGRPIRLNRCTLLEGANRNYAEVMFVGDVHYGSPQCDTKRFIANLNYCLENRIYVFLMGDMVEVATRFSVGEGVYEQEVIADKQFTYLFNALKPLADKGLIIGSHRGNHEARIFQAVGYCPSKALARELKVPFLRDACWSVFRVGGQTYTIYSLHGRSGARFDGTALLALERISTSFFADVVACGHSHKCINSIVMMQRVQHGLVKEHKKHLVICGAYLTYDGGYGQTFGLPISKLGSPKIKFFSDRHDLSITW
jgi:hypothetical protein